jgi:hypothetical protein
MRFQYAQSRGSTSVSSMARTYLSKRCAISFILNAMPGLARCCRDIFNHPAQAT